MAVLRCKSAHVYRPHCDIHRVASQRTGGGVDRTGGEIERSRHVLPLEPAAARTAGPLIDRTGVALQRSGVASNRTGGAIERSRHIFPLEPAVAHTAGLIISRTCAHSERLLLTALIIYSRHIVLIVQWGVIFRVRIGALPHRVLNTVLQVPVKHHVLSLKNIFGVEWTRVANLEMLKEFTVSTSKSKNIVNWDFYAM